QQSCLPQRTASCSHAASQNRCPRGIRFTACGPGTTASLISSSGWEIGSAQKKSYTERSRPRLRRKNRCKQKHLKHSSTQVFIYPFTKLPTYSLSSWLLCGPQDYFAGEGLRRLGG